jgi:biotin carboxyl carrier protein
VTSSNGGTTGLPCVDDADRSRTRLLVTRDRIRQSDFYCYLIFGTVSEWLKPVHLHRPFLGLIVKDTSPKAALSSSQDENRRAQTLLKEGSGTPEGAQQANSDLIQKEAAFDAAQAALLQAKRQLAVPAAQRQAGEAQRAIAQAQVDLANANLSRTAVVSPFRGRVTELTAAKGT